MHCVNKTIVYGRPKDSDKNRYLDYIYAQCQGRTPADSIRMTVKEAFDYANSKEAHRQLVKKMHCCTLMADQCHVDSLDRTIQYEIESTQEYGVISNVDISGAITSTKIRNCPWCGSYLKQAREELLSGDRTMDKPPRSTRNRRRRED